MAVLRMLVLLPTNTTLRWPLISLPNLPPPMIFYDMLTLQGWNLLFPNIIEMGVRSFIRVSLCDAITDDYAQPPSNARRYAFYHPVTVTKKRHMCRCFGHNLLLTPNCKSFL
jgi:hypothetical protein